MNRKNKRLFGYVPGDGYLYFYEKVQEVENDKTHEQMIELISSRAIKPIYKVRYPPVKLDAESD